MDKPEQFITKAYDFLECTKYIEEKYDIKICDYKGKLGEKGNSKAEYCDFWNWLIDKQYVENDEYFEMSRSQANDCNEWQLEILNLYLKEFGDPINFWVSW